METDKEIYQVFRVRPEWIFLLTGLESPGPSSLQSLTLKALERRCDGVVVPEDEEKPLSVVEFQFRQDDTIYLRVALEMVLLQQERQRSVQGIIFFASRRLDPKTRPWKRIVRSYVLTSMLKKLEKAQPHHPLLAVFRPLLEDNERKLENQAATYYRDIKQSDLDEGDKDLIVEVLTSWLVQRFKTKEREEIEAMFQGELPPLEETRVGQDLIRIGKERGIEEGMDRAILLLLEEKFGSIPETIRASIESLNLEDAEAALRCIDEWDTIDGLKEWLNDNRKNDQRP